MAEPVYGSAASLGLGTDRDRPRRTYIHEGSHIMYRLDGKVVLITGASRGIGRATALEVAKRGGIAWLTSRDVKACEGVVDEIRAQGGEAEAMACDVADFASVERVIEHVVNKHGRIDALVNNAGTIDPIGHVAQCDPNDWAQSITVNLVGVFNGCRALLPHFIEEQGGVIVNVSSGAAHGPKEGWSAYCAGKAGVAMLTRSIALEAGPVGVRVYGFQPGVVDTQMQSVIRASGVNEVSRLKREQLADPIEPAHIIGWLCSEEAADLAGQELTIRDPDLRQRAGLTQYSGV